MSIEWVFVVLAMGICLVEDPRTTAKNLATIEDQITQLTKRFGWDPAYAGLVLLTRCHIDDHGREFELIDIHNHGNIIWELVPVTE